MDTLFFAILEPIFEILKIKKSRAYYVVYGVVLLILVASVGMIVYSIFFM